MLQGQSPLEIFKFKSNTKIDINERKRFRAFGKKAWAHKPDILAGEKSTARSEKGRIVGYIASYKAYQVTREWRRAVVTKDPKP
jgi:hypothetical protein